LWRSLDNKHSLQVAENRKTSELRHLSRLCSRLLSDKDEKSVELADAIGAAQRAARGNITAKPLPNVSAFDRTDEYVRRAGGSAHGGGRAGLGSSFTSSIMAGNSSSRPKTPLLLAGGPTHHQPQPEGAGYGRPSSVDSAMMMQLQGADGRGLPPDVVRDWSASSQLAMHLAPCAGGGGGGGAQRGGGRQHSRGRGSRSGGGATARAGFPQLAGVR
jgi:hypothetical protein